MHAQVARSNDGKMRRQDSGHEGIRKAAHQRFHSSDDDVDDDQDGHPGCEGTKPIDLGWNPEGAEAGEPDNEEEQGEEDDPHAHIVCYTLGGGDRKRTSNFVVMTFVHVTSGLKVTCWPHSRL